MEPLFSLPLTFALAYAASALFVKSVIDLAHKTGLFDANNALKLHLDRVPSLGGIAIFSAFWITAFLMSRGAVLSELAWLFAGSFALFLVGVKDDLVGMPALTRLVVQLGVATLLFFNGVKISAVPGLAWELPLWASYAATVLFLAAMVNATNFIDGINGLAGGLAVISSLAFAALFWAAGEAQTSQLALALAGGTLGFLAFNFGRAKIFMGDNGSTFLGIMLSVFSIRLLQPEVHAALQPVASPLLVVAILFVPLTDSVKVVLGRLLRGKSPLRGDRTHIHHLLEQAGLSHRASCLLLYGWNAAVILFALFCLPQNIFLAAALLAVAAGLPYLGVQAAVKFRKEKKEPALHASQAGDFS